MHYRLANVPDASKAVNFQALRGLINARVLELHLKAEFDESEHPRDPEGKFVPKLGYNANSERAGEVHAWVNNFNTCCGRRGTISNVTHLSKPTCQRCLNKIGFDALGGKSLKAEFREEDHPRNDQGEFAPKDGAGESASQEERYLRRAAEDYVNGYAKKYGLGGRSEPSGAKIEQLITDPELCQGQCYSVAHQFAGWADSNWPGPSYRVIQGELPDSTTEAPSFHFAVQVGKLVVDLTGRQFDPKAPVINITTLKEFRKKYPKELPTKSFREEDHPRDEEGQFTEKAGISVDDDLLKATQTRGRVFSTQANTEISRSGDVFIVNQRLGAGKSKPIAKGFGSWNDAKTFVDKHVGPLLTRTTGPAIDEHEDELEDNKSLKNFTRIEDIEDWTDFPPGYNSLGIPRVHMPQIESAHRGAMVQFLKGRGISHTATEMMPIELTPSQKDYSPTKVNKARAWTGPERALLVSRDDYVADGHHQWMQKVEDVPFVSIPIIKLDADIKPLLLEMARFPSSGVAVPKNGNGNKETAPESHRLISKESLRNYLAGSKSMNYSQLKSDISTRVAELKAEFDESEHPRDKMGKFKEKDSLEESMKPDPSGSFGPGSAVPSWNKVVSVTGKDREAQAYTIHETLRRISEGAAPTSAWYDAIENNNLHGDRSDVVIERRRAQRLLKEHWGVDVSPSIFDTSPGPGVYVRPGHFDRHGNVKKSLNLKDLTSSIAQLEVSLDIAESNAPIWDEEGNLVQAATSRVHAASFREALDLLKQNKSLPEELELKVELGLKSLEGECE